MDSRTNKMATKAMLPLIASMAIPPIISMLIQSLYNIIDSIFVAKISENALTAVSLAFPVQNLILACAVGTGVGINSYIARSLGAGKKEQAECAAAQGLLLTMFHYLLFLVFGLLLIKPFFRLFTDVEDIYQMGCDYTYVVVLLSFGNLFHISIEKIIQSTGKMLISMLIQASGAILNIILDPILIFGLYGFPALGVKGAAIATVIAQITAFLISLFVLLSGKLDVKFHFKYLKPKKDTIANIYSVAIPSMMMTALPSILVMCLNSILVQFSNTAVSVFGIYYKIQTFVYMPASGLVQGLRPIIGFNYGARQRDRLLKAVYMGLFVVICIMTLGTLLFLFAPATILAMFNANEHMSTIGIPMLRIICIGFIFSAVSIIISSLYEAMGMGLKSLVISVLRQFIITVPLAFILAKAIGLNGVWICFPIAEAVAAFVAIILLRKTIKEDSVLAVSHPK